MSNRKSIPILIGIIGFLMMLLAGSIGYILGGNNNGSDSKDRIETDSKVMKEIEELKSMYDTKIADKTNNYNALQEEKDRVNKLVSELEKTKGDAAALVKYKTEYKNLESKMKVLVDEIIVLKSKKNIAVSKPQFTRTTKEVKNATSIPIPKSEPVVTKKETASAVKNENVTPKNENLFVKAVSAKSEPTITKTESPKVTENRYSKVTMSNVRAAAYISKSASKQIETNISNKADLIKINFTLDENPNAKAGEKAYYFQIINEKNNVLGKRITEFFDEESLTYSFRKSFDYNNESVAITQEFLQTDFRPGTYYVNIFDRNELVGKYSFVLK
jgi:hypothetical protein